MAASFNYKTYSRQTRMLTEETGFSGGMLWTDNNITSACLKNIVNFDYDDTTAFLKTRNPFVSEQPYNINGSPLKLRSDKSSNLLGAYNVCAHLADNTLTPSGTLYLFGDVEHSEDVVTCEPGTMQALFKDEFGNWFRPTIALYSKETEDPNDVSPYVTRFIGTTTIKPILYDNIFYCTDINPAHPFTVFRLELSFKSKEADYDTLSERKYKITFQPYNAKNIYEEGWDTTIYANINNVTLLNSITYGFNGARGDNTYTFKSTLADQGGSQAFAGVYYTESGKVVVKPTLGTTTVLNIVLDGIYKNSTEDDYGYITVFKRANTVDTDLNSLWDYIGCVKVQNNETPLQFSYTFKQETTTLAFAWVPTKPTSSTTPTPYASDRKAIYAPLTVQAAKTTRENKAKIYKINTAVSSCLWNSRMALWGLEGDPQTLVLSDVDNFYYYPIPNNVVVFDSEVISCIPYMGDLLVFTADKIYKLALDSSGQFTQVVVQNDIPVTKKDAAHLLAIKNMILFKSGVYFYMVVPKTQSLTGELSIAPIYKNIAQLLNNKEEYAANTLSALYPEHRYRYTKDSLEQAEQIEQDYTVKVSEYPSSIYVEQDTIHILYDVDAVIGTVEDGVLKQKNHSYKLFLNYNTNLRAWTTYIVNTTLKTLEPALLTVSRTAQFIRIDESNNFYLAYLSSARTSEHNFRGLIDTGYRSLTTAVKKRFREVQVKMFSETENSSTFGSAFYLDGKTRKCYNKLEEAYIDKDNRVVTLTPALDLNTFLLEDTVAVNENGVLTTTVKQNGSDAIELSHWVLDLSHFKRSAPTTLRIPVSGKGYTPRFVLLATNGIALHINQINWVYRTLYGR